MRKLITHAPAYAYARAMWRRLAPYDVGEVQGRAVRGAERHRVDEEIDDIGVAVAQEETAAEVEDDRGRDALERAHLVVGRVVAVAEDVAAGLVGGGRRAVVEAEGVAELDVGVLGSIVLGRGGAWGRGGGGHRFWPCVGMM